MSEEAGSTGGSKGEGDVLKLPPSPITSDHAGGPGPRTRFQEPPRSAGPPKKRQETTHLPSVLQDVVSLERERQRLLMELHSLKEEQAEADRKLRAAEDARKRQLETMGKYDRFFLNDRGAHPLGRNYAVQQTAVTIQKYVTKLENQKLKLLGKLNHAVDANSEVKTRIDVLRREATVFRELFAKMEAELQSLKKEIAANKSQLEQAYEARDSAQYEMLEIQEELKVTKSEVESEWAALAGSQAGVGTMDSSLLASQLSLLDSTLSIPVNHRKSSAGTSIGRAKSIKGLDRTGGSIKKPNKQQKLRQMEEDWKQITEATGLSTVDELVAFFRVAEDQKFSKAKAITELVSEIASLERELKVFADSTLEEIHDRKAVTEKHSSQLKAAESNTEALEVATADVKHGIASILSEFEELLPVVHSAFVKIGCEKMFAGSDDAPKDKETEDPSKPQLPAMFSAPGTIQSIRSGVNVHNLPLFLGVMEYRAAEIMQQYTALFPNGKNDVAPSKQFPFGPASTGNMGTPPIAPLTASARFRDRSPSKEHLDAKFKAGSLGPSEPTGSIKVVIQSSAIRAAMLEAEKDDLEDCDRPLSRSELHARAIAFATKPQQEVLKSAAIAAAVVLSSTTEGGSKARQTPSGTL